MKVVFDLYFDESGDFVRNEPGRQNRYASQLAGILVPEGQLTGKKASKILKRCYESIEQDLESDVHGSRIRSGKEYDCLISTLIGQIELRESWQPVRLANDEQIYFDFGGVTDYVNMIGELALKIFIEKSQIHSERIVLNFWCAERGSAKRKMQDLYIQTIQNYIAFAAVRCGVSPKYSRWRLGKLNLIRARDSRRIQICDLLSNSSYANYRKCGKATAKLLRQAFGSYDFTMKSVTAIQQDRLAIKAGSHGLAIRLILENTSSQELDDSELAVTNSLNSILVRLANLSAVNRDAQLNSLINLLEQLIEQQRSLDLGYKVARWLERQVYQPLAKMCGDCAASLDWFVYSLHFWMLTASNHQGNLVNSRQAAEKLTLLMPKLVSQWEYTTLLMSGLVADGVHRTDCLEYDLVEKKMKLVADYFTQTSRIFAMGLPEHPQPIRAQLKGKALGTWLQSELYASSLEPARLDRARELSQLCIEEFTLPENKAIQYQYRCQLETIAQDFSTARKFLAKSLDLKDSSHNAIARRIGELGGFSQGFALLHWLRLGTTAYLATDNTEWTQFIASLEQSKLLNGRWCRGKRSKNYPTHGILRRVSIIQLIQQQQLTALKRLQTLKPYEHNSFVLAIIQCAAHAEAAALSWDSTNPATGKSDRQGLQQLICLLKLLGLLENRSADLFPQVHRFTQSWLAVVRDILENEENVQPRLLELGRQISY